MTLLTIKVKDARPGDRLTLDGKPYNSVGGHLRSLADRVDTKHGPRAIGAHFNFVQGVGLVITQTDGIPVYPEAPGCPLWYMAEDYSRAWGPPPDH